MYAQLEKTLLPILLAVVFFTGCKDPFEPEVSSQDLSILIVEGYIEVAGNESKISLSRTTTIRSFNDPFVETGARVYVISSQGETTDLQEVEPGNYTYTGFFEENQTYQLGIILRNNTEYLSDPLVPIITPEIDELGYLRDEFGVEIFVSTKGDENAQYFLWDYEENWIFRPGIRTSFIYNPLTGSVDTRTADQRIDLCWDNNPFSKLILQNSARFSGNQILQRELVRIPNQSEKLMERYSIKVRQRAIDQENFNFWEILRKNSDDIGGIFSPLPSLIQSNLKSISNEEEKVIGYISMGKSVEKRIYIDKTDVFPWPFFLPEYENCQIEIDTTFINRYEFKFGSGNVIPARPVVLGTTTIGYLGAPQNCTDCTLRGSNIKPEFWED